MPDQIVLNNEQSLSTVVTRALLQLMMHTLGVLAVLTFAAQIFGITFQLYAVISVLLMLACLAYSIWTFIADYRSVDKYDIKILLLLFGLGLFGMYLALLINRPDADDFEYVPNAVYFLQNPEKPMDFLLHYFYITPEEPYALSYNQAIAMPYEYFQAVIAKTVNANFLDIYYILMPAIMGFMIPLANFFLAGKFTKDTTLALAGTFIVMVILFTLIGTTQTFGRFAFPRIFQGKAVMLSIGVPGFVAFSLSYFARKSLKNWITVFATITALIGMSASAALLFSLLAFVLLVSLGAAEWGSLKEKKSAFLVTGILYLSTCSSAVLYLLFLWVKIKMNGEVIDPFSLNVRVGDFAGNMANLIEPQLPLTPIFIGISLLLTLVVVTGWQRRFLITWALTFFVLFINPVTAPFLMNTLIPMDIYWRLVYLLPFPISAAVCTGVLADKANKLKPIVLLAVIVIFSYSTFNYIQSFSYRGGINFAAYKLIPSDLENARAISAAAPDGVMLAPTNLFGIIVMLDSSSPQIRSRPPKKGFLIEYDEGQKRENASAFAGGYLEYAEDFKYVINKGYVDVVVCQAKIFRSPYGQESMAILKKNGYIHQKIVGKYIIFWR